MHINACRTRHAATTEHSTTQHGALYLYPWAALVLMHVKTAHRTSGAQVSLVSTR